MYVVKTGAFWHQEGAALRVKKRVNGYEKRCRIWTMKQTRQKKDPKLNPTASLDAPSSCARIQTNSASEHDIPTRATDNPFVDWIGRFHFQQVKMLFQGFANFEAKNAIFMVSQVSN
jgi:hypothetical protein